MKDICIPILIAMSVSIATMLFARKIHHADDDIDKAQRALTGIHSIMNDNANLTFRNMGVDGSMHQRVRFVLAPAYLALHVHQYDTVLTLCSVNANDSLLHAATADQKLLWQNKDDRYYYFLTSRK